MSLSLSVSTTRRAKAVATSAHAACGHTRSHPIIRI